MKNDRAASMNNDNDYSSKNNSITKNNDDDVDQELSPPSKTRKLAPGMNWHTHLRKEKKHIVYLHNLESINFALFLL